MKIAKLLQILVISGLLAGYAAWVQSSRSRQRPSCSRIPLVRLAEARALWRKPSTVFVDVRSATDYAYGHIRGAVNLPEEEFEERFPSLEARLEQAETVVVYCKSRDCAKSFWAALRLRNEGLTNVKVYPNGWYEWSDRGLPSSVPSPR